ncbi:MAG TPA: putative lipid II flippase FtsW [Clostridiales bacterium]|nr:putative lipid II flippase FtsW [Clostridiales bacterium]HPV01008.1 putative lipid II flippase FtsW [Clostridiales bacterium]
MKKKPFDFILFITVLILLSLGLIMVFSASAPMAEKETGNIYYYIKRQLVFAAIGMVSMMLAANYDYHKIGRKTVWALFLVSVVLLILVLIPGIGSEANDSRRWVVIAGVRFQPSELAKLALILFFSYNLSRRKRPLDSFFRDLMPYLFALGIICVLLLLETHLSATIIMISIAMIILFVAGAKIRHFAILFVPVVVMIIAVISFTDYMTPRINSWIDPWSDPRGSGYQTIQSLYAIASGGLFGRGLGQSMQKFLYVPEPHNDYIFPIIAEELGFIGALLVMLLFLIFIWRGIKIAVHAPDVYGCLIASGITALIAVQSLFNVAVVTNSVPPTGVSLPFFSAGGTALVLFMTEAGILLNISRYSSYERI